MKNFILFLTWTKSKNLSAFKRHAVSTIVLIEFIIWLFYTSGKCLHLRKSLEISDSFRKAWIFENFLKIFGNFRKSSEIFGKFQKFSNLERGNLGTRLENFRSFLKLFFKLFCEFWKFFKKFIMLADVAVLTK